MMGFNPTFQIAGIEQISYIWVALATVMAIPGVLFVTWVSVPRLRTMSLIGGTIGTLLGFFVLFFVWIKALDSTHIEGAVAFATAFFVSSVTGLVGALLVNFLGGSPRPRSTQVEF